MERISELKALAELAEQLEDNGHLLEANLVHQQFMKIAAGPAMGAMPMGDMPMDAEAASPVTPDLDLGLKTQFSVALKQYAPKFVQLLAYAPRFGAPTFNVDTADASTVGLIQSMLGVKTDPRNRGVVGDATLQAIMNNQTNLDKMLFNKFAGMYKLRARDNRSPLTIDLWKK
jgi:hypothetical protein